MLMPKRVRRRKVQRGRMKGRAERGSTVTLGEFGLQALEPGWITNTQIEAARVAMTRHIRRGGRVWVKIFPDKPVTASLLKWKRWGAPNTGYETRDVEIGRG